MYVCREGWQAYIASSGSQVHPLGNAKLGSMHQCACLIAGRWEARIGIPGSKHIYLGLFNLEKEAAQAYDRALVRLRGTAAATNFALSDYRPDLAEYHKMQQVVIHTLCYLLQSGTRLLTCLLQC